MYLSSELEESIGVTKVTLDAVYGDQLMNSTPYHLHAVLVHQGQASGGHYWAYIRRLSNPLLRQQSSGSNASHDLSHDVDDVADVTLESQDESSQSTDVTPQTGQTSGQSSRETGQCCQTGQSTLLGRSESVESAADSMCGSQTLTSRTHRTGLPGCRGSEGMEVDRGAVGVAGVEDDGGVWLKFNDVSVSEVGWDEVCRESLGGGQSNTSAYCLIYVSEDLHHQMKQGRLSLQLIILALVVYHKDLILHALIS